MSPFVPALALLAASSLPEVRAVRLTTIDFRPALRVLTSEGAPPGTIAREGEEVVVRIPGVAPEDLSLPEVEPPLQEIRLEWEEATTVLRVKVPAGVPYEASHEPGMLTIVFGEPPSPAERGPITPELYRLLFPTSVMEKETPTEGEEESVFDGRPEGINVGRLRLQPYATVSYVDADILAFASPVPTRARYLQVAPGVTARMPLLSGRFAAEYEPRLRFFSDIPQINATSHFAGALFDAPVGTRTLLRVGHRYTRAVLETTVVDPGREYFFNLARYSFHNTTVAARIDVGPSLTVDLDAGFRWTRFDEEDAGFFDYDSRTLRAGLGYDLRSDLRATVSYAYDRLPAPPDRSLAESSAHNLLGTLGGQIAPLTSGSVTVGFRRQRNPQAVEASASFTGLVFGGGLRRELGYRSSVGLAFRRSTEPSAFEENAYYVTNQVTVSLDVPVPLRIWAQGSGGFLRNDYPTAASATGERRRDDIWTWTVGLGRELGWRSWIRADYRWEKRNSSVPGLDLTTDGFILQVGIGQLGRGAGR